MKKFFPYLILLTILLLPLSAVAQDKKPRKSPKATVSQVIGLETQVTINYSRPGVKGRTIWGNLVKFGLQPGNKYSKNKPFPWRAGANEATTITFSKDVLIEGKALAAGTYSVHMIVEESSCIIIFNTEAKIWGSYLYNQEKDALRIEVKSQESSFEEWLRYGFNLLSPTSAEAFLAWEKKKIPFTISVTK